MSQRNGWYVALGEENRLVVVFSEMGLPLPAVRFRTCAHAVVVCERHNERPDRVSRDFGPGSEAA